MDFRNFAPSLSWPPDVRQNSCCNAAFDPNDGKGKRQNSMQIAWQLCMRFLHSVCAVAPCVQARDPNELLIMIGDREAKSSLRTLFIDFIEVSRRDRRACLSRYKSTHRRRRLCRSRCPEPTCRGALCECRFHNAQVWSQG